ncbi:hypothetical protein, partial [Pantoea sp.]|uniref:hypothetical protein n=1 Tax=Pantoea sp. TaxID=69393 RepID=UPI0028AF4783
MRNVMDKRFKQMTPATKKVINAFISGLAILVTMFVVSIFIRFQDINNDKGIANIEATYHSLLIIESIADRPLSEHFLLPIVTPGGKVNENIPWGATVPTAKGGYIYTSFPSLGYIAPLLFIKTLHLDYSLKSLVAFNLFVQIVAAIILYLALCMAFHADNKKSYIFASLSCVTLFFSREALASTGLLYWPQSLSQLFIALFMLGVTLRIHGKSKSGFFVAWFSVFLLTLTEWTGVT